MTDNELIAEFLGWEKTKSIWDNNEYGYTCKYPVSFNHIWIPSVMPFCSSWDWIMPVVEKIHEHGVWTIRPDYVRVRSFDGEDRSNHMFSFDSSPGDWEMDNDGRVPFCFLVAVVCVKFIKWYNQQVKQ